MKVINKLLSVIMVMLMMVSLLTVSVYAEDSSSVGTGQTMATSEEYPVTDISVSLDASVMTVLGTQAASAVIIPSNATNKSVTWSSSDTTVAQIDSETGVISAKRKGTATIRAAASDGSGVVGSAQLTVQGSSEGGLLSVVKPGGFTFNLYVESSDTIEFIRARIQEKTDYTPNSFYLMFRGTFLEDKYTLMDYGITRDNTIHMLDKTSRYVSFDANGGLGTMEAEYVPVVSASVILPDCTFTPPSGKRFRAWQVGKSEQQAGDIIAVNSDTTVTALWEDIPVNLYTVTYRIINGTWSDGTTEDITETVPEGTAPANIPEGMLPGEGYSVGAWDVDPYGAAINAATTYTYTFKIPSVEPYIDENGAYILGTVEHFEIDGKNYAVNDDGTVGEELDDVSLSYFEFREYHVVGYQIVKYTGPTEDLTELVIPKTFNGRPIFALGIDGDNDSYDAAYSLLPARTPGFTLVLTENISEIKPYTFVYTQVARVTGNTSGLFEIGKDAFAFVNSNNNCELVLELDNYDSIDYANGAFGFDNLIITAEHQTPMPDFGKTGAYSVAYSFTDAHTYGAPTWTWADDYSTATANFSCTYDRCNHTESVDANITTETKNGIITYTATVEMDSETYTDTKTAYEDNIGARLAGYSLSLDGDIGVNFYMELSDDIANSNTAKMHFIIPTGEGTTETDIMVKDAKRASDYFVFKCQVAAKEMTSEIKAQIIDGEKAGTVYTYSVKEYADYLLAHADDNSEWAKAVPIVKAMLNYGAYSQIYFDINSDMLANVDLTDEEKTLGDVKIDIAEPVVTKLPDGTTLEGTTLSLKSDTTLSLYFKSSETLTFTCEDYTVETTEVGDYQVARIRGIKAKDLGNIITLNVNGGAVSYSPLNYCKKVMEDNAQGENLQNVVKALYLYYKTADSYFE